MYITLIQQVAGVGKKDERVLVSDAYARNVLIPKKMGFVGIQSPYRLPESEKTSVDTKKIQQDLSAPLVFTGKANDEGTLYKQVSEKDIIAQVHSLTQVPVKQIVCKDISHLKTVGMHTGTIEIAGTPFRIQIDIRAV